MALAPPMSLLAAALAGPVEPCRGPGAPLPPAFPPPVGGGFGALGGPPRAEREAPDPPCGGLTPWGPWGEEEASAPGKGAVGGDGVRIGASNEGQG